ncbi:MAG: hypothetical protein JXR10_09990 [Cyclobacteriaceae bacterium]
MNQDQPIKSPFKFLDSYAESDKDIFFGREKEAEELYAKVFQGKLLLVYGASGSGKSSVINCGLANKFEPSDWLPIHIRRGGNILQSTFNQIGKEAINTPKYEPSNDNLRKLLSSVFLDHFKPIYLIFDQFEELFIFGYKDEWNAFISAVKYIMETDLDVHFIFVIRGEYLEFLSAFEDFIPEFFDNRVRIEKMTRKNALQSISGPAKEYNIELDEGFEENLIKKINPETAHVELTFLQVFLDKIYRNAVAQQSSEESIKLYNNQIESIGHISDVLAEFVDEQLFRMPDPKAALTVLKAFVSLQGTKTQMTLGQVVQYTKDLGNPINSEQTEEIVRELVNKRILKEKDENEQYELRHDSLAQKIYEKITLQEREMLDVRQLLLYSLNEYKKRELLLTDDNLTYIAPFERHLELDKETLEFIEISKKNSTKRKKSRRTKTVIGIIILLLTITSIIGLIFSQAQKERAEELALVAKQESVEAQNQKALAEQERQKALISEARAQEQAQLANEASARAREERSEALRQSQIAEEQKTKAVQARTEAEQSAEEAIASQKIANEERAKAYRLRVLGLSKEIAVKSTQITGPELKGLMAIQAFKFNKDFNGSPFQSEIYTALYEAYKLNLPQTKSAIKTSEQPVMQMITRGASIFSLSKEGTLTKTKWNNSEPELEVLFTKTGINCMNISVDGSLVILGTYAGEVIGYDLNDSKVIFESTAFEESIASIEANSNEFMLMSNKGSVSRLKRDGSLTETYQTGLKPSAVTSIDDQLVIGTKEGILAFKNANQEQPTIIQLPKKNIKSIAADPNNNRLAIGLENGEILIWDIESKSIDRSLSAHSAAVTDIEFSNNGSFLLSGSFDRSIQLWNLADAGKLPYVIRDRSEWVGSVAFGEDDTFYSGEYDGTIRQFYQSTGQLASRLCKSLDRPMTPEEWTKHIAEDIAYETTCNDE